MALPLLRCCSCNRPVSILIRYFTSKSFLANRSRRLAPVSSSVCDARQYSSERGKHEQNQKVVVIGIPNPFIWFRTRIYLFLFLIRTYFDKEFSIEEFKEGAKQAFSHVSRLLSQCKFEALEGLVAKDLIGKLEGKCAQLPLIHQRALSAESDEIMYTTTGDVGIYYSMIIAVRPSKLIPTQYSPRLPDESVEGARIFPVAVGGEGERPETKRLLTANYEFQREFTRGVTPDWIITRIEHSKLLDLL